MQRFSGAVAAHIEMIELRTLGDLSITVAGVSRRLATDKQSALLVYLACNQGRSIRREQLAGLLWEESGQQRSRHSLSQALYQIRRSIPELHLEASRNEVCLPAGSCQVDAQQFRSAVRANQLSEALDLYQGDFLEGFWVSNSRAFEEWQSIERAELSRLAGNILNRRLQDAEAGGDWLQAARLAARLIRIDQYNEAAHRAHLRAISFNEGRSRALQEYNRVVEVIRTGLGREPELETKMLGASFEVDPEDPGPDLEEREAEYSTPFVGRQKEFSQLQASWNVVKGGNGQAILISGEPGIGKTRLAYQFLRFCAIHGARVFQGQCYATDRYIPYSGIASGLLGGIRESDVVRLSSEWSAVLAEILPELHPFLPERRRAMSLEGEGARRRLFEGVAQFFQSVSEHSPVALHIDDFQWCDESSAALLHYLVRRLRDAPILIMLGMRPVGEAVHMRPELRTIGWDARQGYQRLDLQPLAYPDVEQIVQAYAERNDVEVTAEICQEIYALAGGRPFFIVEILNAISQGALDWGVPDQSARHIRRSRVTLPPSIEEFLWSNMHGLSEDADSILASLAILGTRADPRLVGEVVGIKGSALVRAVEELRARELIQETESEIYYSHDLIREAAYQRLGKSRRRLLHEAAAHALSQRRDTPPAILSTHYDYAGLHNEAYTHALDAATESSRVHGHLETEHFLGIALANATDTGRVIDAKERLATLFISLSRFAEAEEYLEELRIQVELAGDSRRLLGIRSKLITIALKQGSAPLDELSEEIKGLIELAEEYEEHGVYVELLKNLVIIGHTSGQRPLLDYATDQLARFSVQIDSPYLLVTALAFVANAIGIYKGVSSAIEFAERAVQYAVKSGDEHAIIIALCSRGINRMQAGMLSLAGEDLRKALSLIERLAAYSHQQFAKNSHGVLLLEQGSYAESRAVLNEAILQAADSAAVPDLLLATGNLLLVEYKSGNRAEAQNLAKQVLELSQQAPFLWATIGALSIFGIFALERGDLDTARKYREQILMYAAGRDFWGADASYAEIFFARLKVKEGDPTGALERLEEAIAAYRDRDFFCRSRLRLERAQLLLATDPATAGREAAEIRALGKESGARPLVEQADQILDRLSGLA